MSHEQYHKGQIIVDEFKFLSKSVRRFNVLITIVSVGLAALALGLLFVLAHHS